MLHDLIHKRFHGLLQNVLSHMMLYPYKILILVPISLLLVCDIKKKKNITAGRVLWLRENLNACLIEANKLYSFYSWPRDTVRLFCISICMMMYFVQIFPVLYKADGSIVSTTHYASWYDRARALRRKSLLLGLYRS